MTKKKPKRLHKKNGRPTVMTNEVIAKLENAFAQGLNDTDSCILAGISRDSLYDYIKKEPTFATKKEELKRRPFLSCILKINAAIKMGDLTTARWYAERKGKDEFSLRTENTGKDGKDLIPDKILRDDIK